MPPKPQNSDEDTSRKTAESLYREAFERLKQNRPALLPPGTQVSQNNVAKEAGRDPTALRKSRFPSLVAEIQHWIDQHGTEAPPSARQRILAQRARNRTHKEQLEILKSQRDHSQTLLIEAVATILDYANQNTDLRSKLEKLYPSAKVVHTLPRGDD